MYPRQHLKFDETTSPDTTTSRIRRALSFESIDTAIGREACVFGFELYDTMDGQIVPDLDTLHLEVENLATKLDQTRREMKNLQNKLSDTHDHAPGCGCTMCMADRPVKSRLDELASIEEGQNAELKARMDLLREVTALMSTDVANPDSTGPTPHYDFSMFSKTIGPMGTKRTGYAPPDYAHSTPRTDNELRDGQDTPTDDSARMYDDLFVPQCRQSLPMQSRIAPASRITSSSNSERVAPQNEATKSVHFKLTDESL